MTPSLLDDVERVLATLVSATDSPSGEDAQAFDLQRYCQHIRGLTAGCIVEFEGVSRIIADPKLDRIFRFVAILFLETSGEVEIEQDTDGRIRVMGR